MATTNDSLRVTQFIRNKREQVFRGLARRRTRQQVAMLSGMPRDFMRSRGGGGWKVSRVHAVRR